LRIFKNVASLKFLESFRIKDKNGSQLKLACLHRQRHPPASAFAATALLWLQTVNGNTQSLSKSLDHQDGHGY
jgi:hypothetical protein